MQSQLSTQRYGGGSQDLFDVVRTEFERMLNNLGMPIGYARRPMIPTIGGATGLSSSSQSSIPVDIIETDKNYILHAELPGLSEQDVEVTASQDTLTIRGQRQYSQQYGSPYGAQYGSDQQGQQGGTGRGSGSSTQGGQQATRSRYHAVERAYGEFVRSFTLPPNVDTQQITAEFNRGVLEITLPKTQDSQQQQRRIEVHQGSGTSSTSTSSTSRS